MVIFLENALGFFIQLFPCALMIFFPFSEEAYRFRRRAIYFWMTLISVVFACIYAAALCLRDLERYPNHVALSNSFMLAAMLLILAAYIWLVREALLKKILTFLIVLFYAVTVFILVNAIYPFVADGDLIAHAYNGIILAMYAGITAGLLPVMLFFVLRPLEEYIREIEPNNMKREFFIAVLSTLLYFIMIVYCVSFYETDSGGREWSRLQQQCFLMLVIMLNQILIYWLILRESVRRKRDDERQRAMEIQQMQYEKIVGDMESTRRMRHDLRHHYNALNDLLDRGKTEEMRAYLSEMIDTTVRRDSETYCADLTVNGLLQYYIGLARDEKIRCRVHAVCEKLAIEPADLTVLFGNAMENAINACRKCPQDRWISIKVGTVQGSLAIEISNSCKSVRLNRRFQTEDGFSPAEAFLSDHGGGYGLRSITRTAQKYGGSASFRFNSEKGMFTARIRLNINAGDMMMPGGGRSLRPGAL